MTKQQLDTFLGELKELYLKHHLAVVSCGCCGTWVQRVTPRDIGDEMTILQTSRWGDKYEFTDDTQAP